MANKNLGTVVRIVFVFLGSFVVFTAGWVVAGLLTPSDRFATADRFAFEALFATIPIGALVGYGVGGNKWGRICLLALVIAAAAFWVCVPNGWWVKGPPRPY